MKDQPDDIQQFTGQPIPSTPEQLRAAYPGCPFVVKIGERDDFFTRMVS